MDPINFCIVSCIRERELKSPNYLVVEKKYLHMSPLFFILGGAKVGKHGRGGQKVKISLPVP